ncbi:hypothetical protein BDV93DRAFT_564852 [Ceratobasidium sp. AG-I]|nr:hypothetical protein BDV93DRAFT_564852 [Ceratobasidium sp. AG-I]
MPTNQRKPTPPVFYPQETTQPIPIHPRFKLEPNRFPLGSQKALRRSRWPLQRLRSQQPQRSKLPMPSPFSRTSQSTPAPRSALSIALATPSSTSH